MAPIDSEEARSYYGGDGKFLSIRELKAGEAMEVELHDISKNFRTKFPIKEKDYSYRVTLTDNQGQKRLLDVNGLDSIRQFVNALFPNGPDKAMIPCKATLKRRTERRKTQGELEIVRGTPLADQDTVTP